MKKGLIFSLIISFIVFLGLSIFAVVPKTDFSTNKIEKFNKFESSLIAELQNDDYSYTEINKNVSLSQLKEKVEPNSKNNQATIFNMEDNKILTTNELNEYCEQNDLILEETDNGYQVINKYALKRLIVFGTLPSNHNASKVISYDNMNILCYNSIEETKSAYLNLKSNNIEVTPDFIISATNTNEIEIQSTSFNNWSEVAVDLDAYNDYSTTKQAVVAVLDTGINTLHPVFENRLLKENDKIVGTSYYSSSYTYNKDNIQLSTIDDYGSNLSFEDDNGHGSHVAGIIASQTPSNVKILPMRVLKSNGKGDFSAILAALEKLYLTYSNSYNIVCANLSLGGAPGSDYFSTGLNNFNTIFNKLKSKNILSIVAAGNDSTNTSSCLPAACGDSAIVVSALTSNNSTYYGTHNLIFANTYSNFGTSVDISAPGTSINSAWKASSNSSSTVNQTKSESGTSMATPHVSACVAKLCLDNDFHTTSTPSYTASQIEEILFSSALDLDNDGKDIYLGHGALRYTNINEKTEPKLSIYHTSSNATYTYDGNYHNISISVTQPTSGYTIKYSLENDGVYDITDINGTPQFKNANDSAITIYYQITAPGYITATGSKTLKINKRKLTYNVENQTSTYGKTSHLSQSNYTKTSGSIITGDELNLSLTTTATRYSNVGRYNINLTHSNSNYEISANSATLTINPKDIEITISNTTSVYGDSFSTNNIKYSCSEIVNNDNLGVTLNISKINFSQTGTYEVTYDSHTNTNYNITNTTTKGSHTIQKRTATINIANLTSTYGENFTLNQVNYSVVGLVNGDTINNITLSTNAVTGINPVGSYIVKATYTENNNYTISVNNGNYTVTKRPIKLETLNQTFTYGETINIDQTKYSIKSGSFASNDQDSVNLTSNAKTELNAGNYDINLTFNNSSNYDVTLTKGKAIVNKRIITIEITNEQITNQEVEYGNELNLDENSYTIKTGNILAKDQENFKMILTSQTNPNNSESYLVSATCTNANYSIVLENNQITIVPRKLTITIPDQSFEYGNAIDLQYLIASGSFAFNDETSVKLSTTATSSSALGNYATDITFNNIDKYSLSISKGKVTITPKQLKLEINNQDFTYGDPINLNQLDYTIKSGSFAFDDQASVSLSTSATQNSNADEYAINVQFNNMDKYALTINNGKAIINPRPITISTQQSKIYGEENNLDNAIYTIEEGSVIEDTDLELTFTSTATKLSPIGDYEISLLSHNSNYDINLNNSYLTINPKLIEIYVLDQSGIYGNVVKLDQTQYSVDMFDIVEGSDLGIILSTDANHTNNIESYSNSTNKPKPVGNYTISATSTNPNYILDVEEGTFTINKRKISIRLYDQSVPHTFNFTYNKEDYDIMSGSIVGDDNLNISLTTNATSMSFAGDYDIIATYLNENYDITFTDATLTLEFSYVDALMILVPTAILVLVATLVLVVFIKRKNKSIPLYKKWTK